MKYPTTKTLRSPCMIARVRLACSVPVSGLVRTMFPHMDPCLAMSSSMATTGLSSGM